MGVEGTKCPRTAGKTPMLALRAALRKARRRVSAGPDDVHSSGVNQITPGRGATDQSGCKHAP
jgi:hypothetical protein